jgi:RNA polymerase sporulation-specific sigma factor
MIGMTTIDMSLEDQVEGNKRLVYYVAKKFIKRAQFLKVEFDDLASEGMIGLIKAIRKFDSNYGVKFSTYAVPVIEGQIRRFLRDSNPGLKFSRMAKEISIKIDGNESVEEIMEEFQVKRFYAEEALAYKNNSTTLSMDYTFGGDDDKDLTIADTVGYKEDFSSLEMNDFLNYLPLKLKTVVDLLMKSKTQKEIGDIVGCSQVQVSRLIKKIQSKYQEYLEGNEVAAITLEQYQAGKENGLSDAIIAKKYNIAQPTLIYHKKRWFKDELESDEVEKKPPLTKSIPNTIDDTKAEYERLIASLRNDLKESHTQLDEKDELIQTLQITVEKYERVCGSSQDAEKEIGTLRDEKDKLQREYDKIVNHQYHKDYQVENQRKVIDNFKKTLERYEDENKAFRALVRLWI